MTDRPPLPACDGKEGVQPPARRDLAKLVLLEETAQVSKREVVVGKVRVSTRTETHQEVAEVSLDRNVIDVTRVPVGKVVDVAPAVRTEDDTTIVPVIEERFVVVKQLFLLEEVHIRHRVEHGVSSVPVELRRQTAVVERVDLPGSVSTVSELDIEEPHQGTKPGESHGHS